MTVRKALEVLREEGLVGSRQGFGWFVVELTSVGASVAPSGLRLVR
jgi:DNA-binding GntR family transcriptional regulator